MAEAPSPNDRLKGWWNSLLLSCEPRNGTLQDKLQRSHLRDKCDRIRHPIPDIWTIKEPIGLSAIHVLD